MTFPFFGDRAGQIEVGPPDTKPPEQMLAENRLTRTYALSQQLLEGAETQEDYVQAVLELPGRRVVHVHRVAAAGGAHARRVPVRRQDRLLPAVLGRDGAAAADGRHPGAGRHRLLDGRDGHQDRRVRGARLRRPLVGRGLLPRLGLDHVRPDARRLAGAQPARRRAASSGSATGGSVPRFGDPLAERGAGDPGRGRRRSRGGTGRSASWRPRRARAGRCWPCAAGAAARRRR